MGISLFCRVRRGLWAGAFAALGVAGTASAQGLPQAEISVLVNGEPVASFLQDPATLDPDGSASYIGEISDPRFGWQLTWDLATSTNSAGDRVLSGSVATDNTDDVTHEFQVVISLPVCPLDAAKTLIGGSVTIGFLTDANGGQFQSTGGSPAVWTLLMDDAPAKQLYLHPFGLYATGAGSLAASQTFGTPFPNEPGLPLFERLGLALDYKVSDGDFANIQSTVVAGPDGLVITASPPEDQCPSDLNEDGLVDVFDLSAILTAWGVEASCVPADLDESGMVDEGDVAMLLSDWGGCDAN